VELCDLGIRHTRCDATHSGEAALDDRLEAPRAVALDGAGLSSEE
jgi:hypothetical protein